MTSTNVAEQPETYTVLDRTITLPNVVRDATAAVAFYLVSASAAQKLIDESGLKIAQILPGRTVCTIGTMNYKDSDLDGYYEVALTFFVHEPKSRPIPLISAMLGMARGSLSAYVHWLPVNGELTCEAGRKIWGFPKFVTQIDLETEGDIERSTLTVDGQLVMTQTVKMGGSRSFTDRKQIAYSMLDGVVSRIPSDMSAEDLGARMGGATIELGTHPMADELRSLGLPKKALFTTYMGKMSCNFYAAERSPAPL
jgi:hypothetical protein